MRSARFGSLLVLLALALAFPSLAQAYNGGAAVCVHPSGYRVPLGIVATSDSGAIIVYGDTRNDTNGIYAQRMDHRGRPMWAAGGVLIRSLLDIDYSFSAVSDGANGIITTWGEDRGATSRDIMVQRVLSNGTLGHAGNGLVVCSAAGIQRYPMVRPGPAGSYYVVWADLRAGVASQNDFYVQRLTFAGAPQFVANGIPVHSAASRAADATTNTTHDLLGGLIVTWFPAAGGLQRAQRVTSTGTLSWGPDGVQMGVPGDFSFVPTADGSGGAYFSYVHGGAPYAQHILAAGTLGFPAAGIALDMPALGSLFQVQPIRNASGGCFFYARGQIGQPSGVIVRQEINAAGTLLRGDGEALLYSPTDFSVSDVGNAAILAVASRVSGTPRVKLFVQRFNLDGTPVYPGMGVIGGRDEGVLGIGQALCAGLQNGVTTVAFVDNRYMNPFDPLRYATFGQAFGAGGVPLWDDSELPVIVSAADAPNDQGGFVRVNWNSGSADLPGAAVVTEYLIWRSVPPAPAARILAARAAPTEGTFQFQGRTWLAHANAFWEMVAQQPAARLPSYALTAPTGQDSISGSPADESFMVEARDDSMHIWFSGALSTHSVDNLAPAIVAPADGFRSHGSVTLFWGPSTANDLCCYEIYRGSSPGFVPSAANRIATVTDITVMDPDADPAWYRIAARDVHGNIGLSALVLPAGTLDADHGTAPRAWGLRAAWLRGNHTLTLALDVPQADEGTVEVFDASGRRLWSAPFRTESAQSLALVAARDTPLAPGVVFARVRAASGRTLNARAVVIR